MICYGPSIIIDNCKKPKTRLGEWGVLAKFVSWKIGARLAQNAHHFRQALMRSTFVKLRCAALPSGLDAQLLREHSQSAGKMFPVTLHTTTVKIFCLSWRLPIHFWCCLHMTCATGMFHIHVCTMIILTLAVHVFCEHAIEPILADTSHCSECIHMCMDIISRKYRSCI